MSPAMTTVSTFWLRNHSSVCLKVRLLPKALISSFAPTRRMWMSETTPNFSFGAPAADVPPEVKNRQPLNAPSAPNAAPPMKNCLLEIFMFAVGLFILSVLLC